MRTAEKDWNVVFKALINKLKERYGASQIVIFKKIGMPPTTGRNVMAGRSSAGKAEVDELLKKFPELIQNEPGELTKDYFDQRINEVMRMIEELRDAQIEMSEKAIQRSKETIKRYSR